MLQRTEKLVLLVVTRILQGDGVTFGGYPLEVVTENGYKFRLAGVFEAVVDEGNSSSNVAILEIVELCELGIFLGLAAAANLARTRSGLGYARARTAFWVGTIVVVILWSISSLLSIVTSGRATPGNIITMTATVIISVLMIADKLVVTWNNIDPSTMTEQEANRNLNEPLVPQSKEEGEGWHRDALEEQERLSLKESGGATHVVDPNPEGQSGPKHGTPSTYRSGGLQPDEETGFPM